MLVNVNADMLYQSRIAGHTDIPHPCDVGTVDFSGKSVDIIGSFT